MIIDRVTFFNSLAMKPLFSHLPASHLSDGGRETLPALNNACSQRLLSTTGDFACSQQQQLSSSQSEVIIKKKSLITRIGHVTCDPPFLTDTICFIIRM